MKKFLISILFLSALSGVFACDFIHKYQKSKAQWDVGSDGFVEGSKDIPLAKGLKEYSQDSLGFDSADGSIVAVAYKNKIEPRKIYDFYYNTLPQLGWEIAKGKKSNYNLLRLKRENEKLEIEFSKRDGVNLVKFYIETVAD